MRGSRKEARRPRRPLDRKPEPRESFRKRVSSVWFLPAVLLAGGFLLRMVDLTDEPLDRPERQLRSAILARGLYYQWDPSADPARRAQATEMADSLEAFEPPMFETLVAASYLVLGREVLWLARVYASLAWLAAGVVLYLTATRLTSSRGGLVALAFFLFLPASVIVARVFQPDPWMILGVLATLYLSLRWMDEPLPRWAIASGIAAGLAILFKAFALLPVLGVMIAGWPAVRALLRNRWEWARLGLALAIPGIYYAGILFQRSPGYVQFWTLSFLPLLTQLRFYTGWLSTIRGLVESSSLLAGAVGTLLLPPGARRVVAGLWIGTLAYGMSVPFQSLTHDYYSLLFVPLVALGLAPVGDWILARLERLEPFGKTTAIALGLAAIAYPALLTRNALLSVDYRGEPPGWRRIASEIPTDGDTIALTHEYGYRLMYYGGRQVTPWPMVSDLGLRTTLGEDIQQSFPERFQRSTQSFSYFLVTLMGELRAQSDLREALCRGYTLMSQSKEYLLFDLRHAREDGVDVCPAAVGGPGP